jgi:RND family efflux transporter MFP subunit
MLRAFVFSLVPAVLLTFAGCSGGSNATKVPPPPPPLQVDTKNPKWAEVQEFAEFTGRTTAMETIELRARVSGYLDEVMFSEGARVEAGTALFRIDSRPFVAEKQRTAAAVSQIDARLERLAGQERRARELFEKKAISQDEYDMAKYDLDEVTAALAEARAADEIANLNVTFTTVTAPINGRIGRRMVDVGNLVTADQTILATLVSDESLYIYFDMDERTFLRLRRMKSGTELSAEPDNLVEVDVALADSDTFDRKGTVDFFDNQLDSATGTLRVRATVPNTDSVLSPGLFVRVRYPVGDRKKMLTIPEVSLASDQGKPYVFVVGPNAKGVDAAMRRNVELGPLNGNLRAISSVSGESGTAAKSDDQPITAEDQIIVTGLQRLRSGMAVKATLKADASDETDPSKQAEH